MAILNIMTVGEECLEKKCKEVKVVNKRIQQLAMDMFDTMYEHDGVGLAAPQVGILKRMFVVDVTPEDPEESENVPETSAETPEDAESAESTENAEGSEIPEKTAKAGDAEIPEKTETPEETAEEFDNGYRFVMINPEILETGGEQIGYEGCLSKPGYSGLVKRPESVRVAFTDINGERKTIDARGLLARCILHENDHLDGVMFMARAEGPVLRNEDLQRMIEEQEKARAENKES